MPQVSKYAPGTPSWVDLASPDPAASQRFYGDLFGWTFDTDPSPDAHGYTMVKQGGLNVAGMAPQGPGQPPTWTSYVTVEDADATVAKAKDAGGSLIAGPMDVTDVGRMAVLADPTGAVIALWQPRAHHGADLVNEPNALCWNELQSRDPERAKPFYESVFGWTGAAEESMPYTQWMLGDEAIGGMQPMAPQTPAQIPSYWSVYFAVADTDAIAARAKSLGGQILAGPMQIPPGNMAVIADPHGASFQVLEFA